MSDSSIATAKITGIYNNVACLLISTDLMGEAWVHFGVELRGQGAQRQPYLSTFGGAIDINSEGKTETPMQALTRELHEEALGLLDNEVTLEKLSNPNLTYSFIYSHPTTLSATVVFALQIDHEKIELIKKQFDIERSQRIHQQNNKKFTSQAETEIKEIRSVKLSELKNHLTATKDDTTKAIICATEPSFSLNLDRKSIKLNEKNELVDYQIWMQDNTPVTTPIPAALPIRLEVIKSLVKLLPGLEYRFFNTPIISNKQPIELGFYGKSLRADQFCFIEEFFDTLPIKGLTQQQRVSEKRIGRRDPFTARGTELIDATLKTEYGIAQQYTEQQKAEFSEFQSLSYFSVPHGTPVFGWGKNRQDCLLGIAHIDMLPNRFFIYDGGTVERPYDDKNIAGLKEYVQRNALSNEPLFFDVSDLENFKKKVDSLGNQKYNEILGRLRWDIDHTCICVFSDNETTLWIAIAWAQKIENKIKEKSLALYQNKEISEEQYIKFNSYQSKIAYYNPTNKKTGYYSESQIDQFKKSAYALYDNLALRTQYYQAKNYEFVLLIDEKEKLAEILSDQTLMRTIMHTRLYIAETLIEKYYTLTKNPFILTGTETLQLENITRSFLEKLINGVITGLPLDSDQKIILDGFTIANKDLSGMNLSKFNFNGCHLEKCHLKAVTLNIQGHEKVTFTKCDFSNTTTINCDFSSVTFVNDCIFNKNDFSLQLLNKIGIAYYRNFNLNKAMDFLEKTTTPSKQQLAFILQFALHLRSEQTIEKIITKYNVLGIFTYESMPNSRYVYNRLLRLPIEKNNAKLALLLLDNDINCLTTAIDTDIEFAKKIIIQDPRFSLAVITNENNYNGHNALTMAIKRRNITLATFIINHSPDSALHVITTGYDYEYQGHNALTMAIKNNHTELAMTLIEKNPDLASFIITDGHEKSMNILTLAIHTKNNEITNFMIEKNPNALLHVITEDNYKYKGHNALTIAIKNNHTELAITIIKKNPNLAAFIIANGEDKGHNILTLSICKKNHDLAMLILQQAPNTALHAITDTGFMNNSYQYQGHNALTMSIQNGYTQLAMALMEKKPELISFIIGDGNEKGYSILSLASKYRNIPLIAFLSKKTAQASIQSVATYCYNQYTTLASNFTSSNKMGNTTTANRKRKYGEVAPDTVGLNNLDENSKEQEKPIQQTSKKPK